MERSNKIAGFLIDRFAALDASKELLGTSFLLVGAIRAKGQYLEVDILNEPVHTVTIRNALVVRISVYNFGH